MIICSMQKETIFTGIIRYGKYIQEYSAIPRIVLEKSSLHLVWVLSILSIGGLTTYK